MDAKRILALAMLALLLLLQLTIPAGGPALAQTATATPSQPDDTELIAALQGGGYVIYFRHAHTDRSQTDRDLTRCDQQRNLDEQGRADAVAIGQAFLRLRIPLGTIHSSEYCRAQDTARLAFGRVEVAPGLASADAWLKEMLSTAPQPGTNAVVVAHGFIITRVAGITIAEGEAVVFEPLGPAGFRVVARLLPDEWSSIPAQAGS